MPRHRTSALPAALAACVIALAAGLAMGASPSLAAGAGAAKRVVRCRAFRVKEVRHGKVVRRHGKVVYTRRRQCVKVPAKACTVRWTERRRKGHVVVKDHNPVRIAKVTCPPAATAPAPPAVAPAPPAASPPATVAGGPGNAAVAVYAVTVQGYTFDDRDLNGALPAQSIIPLETVNQSGYLVRLLTPFAGLDGQPAQDSIGLFLGSLDPLDPLAGTTQFATNTLMLSAADAGNTSLWNTLPYPFAIGQVSVSGEQLVAQVTLQSLERATPVGGATPDFFVDRTGLATGTVKHMSAGAVSLQFANGDASVSGVFEFQGSQALTTIIGGAGAGEPGVFGFRGTITGTRLTAPGGASIYLPPPLPSTPAPPGCRTELRLVPGVASGSLTEQEQAVCH